jgi:hypothetical protein
MRIEIAWDEAGIIATDGGAPARTLPWGAVRVVLLTSEGFLVEGKEGPGLWLPFSGFAHREAVDRFEAEVRARTIPVLDRSAVG